MKKEKLRLWLLCLMAMMAVRGLAQTTYTVSPSQTDKPNENISYSGYTWLAYDNAGTYIKAFAYANNDGEVTLGFKKNSGEFKNDITAYLYKDLKGSEEEFIKQITVEAGNTGKAYKFKPGFTNGSHKYVWLIESKSSNGFVSRYCTVPITVRGETETAPLQIVGGKYFGSTKLDKDNPPTFQVKIKNDGTERWNGCFFLKYEDEDWVKLPASIDGGQSTLLTGIVITDLSSKSDGEYKLTLFYQTNNGGKGKPVPTSGNCENPFTVELTSFGPTPEDPSPADRETDVSVDLKTLSWSCSGTNYQYNLYFATDPDFDHRVGGGGHVLYANGYGNSCKITTGQLEPNRTYYWKVGMIDSKGKYYWNDWSFTTAAADSPSSGDDLTIEQAVTYLHGKNSIVDGATPSAAYTTDTLLRQQLAKIAFMGLYNVGGRSMKSNNIHAPSDAYPTVYSDLGEDEYYSNAAKALLYLEYGDGITPFDRDRLNFKPRISIARVDVLKVLMETFNIKPNTNLSNPFPNDTQVSEMKENGNPKYGYIAKAAQMGIIKKPNGSQNNNWRPYANCTRGEAFIMLARIMMQIDGLIDGDIEDPDPTERDYFEPLNITLETISRGMGLPMGNFQHYTKTSFVINGVAPMMFAHTYNSYNTTLPSVFFGAKTVDNVEVAYQPLGDGWSHSYHTFITNVDGRVIVHWGGGAMDVYKLNGSTGEPVSLGIYDKLKKDGNNFVITTKSQVKYTFRTTMNNVYYLSEIADRNENKVEITYEYKNNMYRIRTVASSDCNGSGKRSLTFSYGINGTNLVTQVRDPLSRSISFDYEYNRHTGRYQLTSFTDAANHTTHYYYGNDDDGNENAGLSKLLTRIKLPEGNVITNEYDARNRRLQSTRNGDSETAIRSLEASSTGTRSEVFVQRSINNSTTYKYEFNGNNALTQFKSADNRLSVTNTFGNSSHKLLPTSIKTNSMNISNIEYDGNGNVKKVVVKSDDGKTLTTNMTYTELNDLKTVTDPKNNTTTYNYDGKGNLKSIDSPISGISTKIERFENGLINTITNPAGVVTQYEYDDRGYGNLKKVTLDPGKLKIITQPKYDDVGRLKEIIDALNRTYSYNYNDNDNLESVTTPINTISYRYDDNDNLKTISSAGQTTTLDYDQQDRLTSVSFGGFSKDYTYNDDGTLATYINPNGNTLTYWYDDLGRITNDGVNSYDYYPTTLLLRSISPISGKGKTLSFDYDGFGRIKKAGDASYQYDENSNVTNINGTEYEYDALNRLYRVKFNGRTITYNYRNDSQLSTIDYNGVMTTTYGYDSAGRMTSKTTKLKNGKVIASYKFDGNDDLDKVGNIKKQTKVEPFDDIILTNGTENYEYGEGNNRITKAGDITFEFDDNGNTTKRGGETYSWDELDRMTSNGTTDITYDPLGLIASYGDITFTTDPLGVGNVLSASNYTKPQQMGIDAYNYKPQIVDSLSFGNVLSDSKGNKYIYGLGLEARVKNGKVSYYVTDVRGSVVAIVDESGNITHKYQYDEFGKVTQKDEADYNPFQYVGKYGVMYLTDHQYYMRARHYDPTIGRFLSEDPIWSTNLYPYADNNPIMEIDPEGLTGFFGTLKMVFSWRKYDPGMRDKYTGPDWTINGVYKSFKAGGKQIKESYKQAKDSNSLRVLK